ncbi:MAG: hypothetical protein HN742_19085 [Lentisphaerae bacterium]|jgi:putative transposase|nr:hypothetical protein [Lentisphaerota bacterium]MBT4817256.1 hypothetical protein [Lentisphaerota bacterium]MBT5607796.1 hypothetical protein [Lentisphaerota bacterium]MBT7061776.1 hypothetical protein [Lentisphaerota bacterium]MBT7843992.1 hypothetical protein [Lentisphaerota bacterium]
MRGARIRYDRERCYYHLMNRVAGEPDYLPFGDVEKEHFLQLVQQVSTFYSLDVLSVVAMSNHYHIVCAAPADMPCEEEVQARWRAYYGDKHAEPNWSDKSVIDALGARMRDVSSFCKDVQQRFTSWFNRTRPRRRRGTLWADRFKSVILEGQTALWEGLKYVEMNPVRAGLCSDPRDYRFGTWGRMVGSGVHPFAANLVRHLRQYLGERAQDATDGAVIAELCSDMARVIAAEQGLSSEEIFAAAEEAKTGDGFVLTVGRRVRYWSDGAVIGSKLFVRRIAGELFDPERVAKKRLSVAHTRGDPADLCAYRRLNPSL